MVSPGWYTPNAHRHILVHSEPESASACAVSSADYLPLAPRQLRSLARVALFCLGAILLVACGGGDDEMSDTPPSQPPIGGSPPPPGENPPETDPPPPAEENDPPPVGTTALGGVVVDGPVTGAVVIARDSSGQTVAEATSDATGRFTAFVPVDASYPLALAATGGMNVTTGNEPGFTLLGVVADADQDQVVLSSISTLLARGASCAAESTGQSEADALAHLLEHVGAEGGALERWSFGLGRDQLTSALHGRPESAQHAAALLLASEALAESLRRASAALSTSGAPVSVAALIEALGCALANETPGVATNGIEAPLLAALHGAAIAVLLEAAAGELWVAETGQNAAPVLEQAISTTFGFQGSTLAMTDLPMTPELVENLAVAIHAALAAGPTDALFDLYAQVTHLANDTTRATFRSNLQGFDALRGALGDLLTGVATDAELAADLVQWLEVDLATALPPDIALDASPRHLPQRDGSTMLNYSATHASACRRIDAGVAGWAGLGAPEQGLLVGPIESIQTFELICAGPGGVAQRDIEVTVPPGAQIEFVRVNGDPDEPIQMNDLVRFEVSVVDGTVEDCSFTRTDTGATLSPGDILTAEPGLGVEASCGGLGGTSSVASVSIPVQRAIRLDWIPPSQFEDGEPLAPSQIAGYRIYVGTAPGAYGDLDPIVINDSAQTSHVLTFESSGDRYLTMTAVTTSGDESRFSNQLFVTIR